MNKENRYYTSLALPCVALLGLVTLIAGFGMIDTALLSSYPEQRCHPTWSFLNASYFCEHTEVLLWWAALIASALVMVIGSSAVSLTLFTGWTCWTLGSFALAAVELYRFHNSGNLTGDWGVAYLSALGIFCAFLAFRGTAKLTTLWKRASVAALHIGFGYLWLIAMLLSVVIDGGIDSL